jgi:hypothetical protein
VTAAEWLTARLPGAPEPLLAEMIAALPQRSASLPDALAEGARSLYARLLRGADDREAALPLLAADALLTHAFQAQAEIDADGVAALAARWGASGRLGDLAQRAS